LIGVSGSISIVQAGSTRTPCGTCGPGTARVVRAGFFAARPCRPRPARASRPHMPMRWCRTSRTP
jgi:hypothetical protein